MSIIQGHAKSSGVTAFYPTTIDQSLRFEDGDSAYLTFDPAADGDRDNWSLSFWFKRANLGLTQLLFGQGTSGSNNRDIVYIAADDTLEVASYGGSYVFRYITTQKFRDPSAWYHLVISYQSGDATASDRLRIYLNGERITAFSTSTDPSLNADSAHFNSGSPQYFGRYIDQSGSYLDGYLAEAHFTDGTAYQASTYGELKSGIWVAKSPSVTYGTNGFHLALASSDLNTSGSAIDDPYGSATQVPDDAFADASGSGNHWGINGLVASDVVPDSPTNNFAVLNNLEQVVNYDFSEGNLRATRVSNIRMTRANFAMPTGKWYWEMYLDGGPTYVWYGVGDQTTDSDGAASVYTGTGYLTRRNSLSNATYDSIFEEGTETTNWGVANVASGDIVMIAYDADAGKIWFGYNGDWEESGDPANGTNEAASWVNQPQTVIPFFSAYAQSHIVNFGQDSTFAGNETAGGNSDANGIGDFAYAPPSGYLALCTANLPDPVIDPAQDATPEDHFNVALWTGNSSTQSIDVGHASDFVWIKTRNAAVDHRIYDSVRGVNKGLKSNTTAAEATETTSLTSFDSTGFSLGNFAANNNSGSTYVGWSWKAGGTGVANTDGSINSTVSANTDAGFSIVQYDDGTDAVNTVGHGLTSAPEMVIVKNRTDATPWRVYHLYSNASDPEDYYLDLDATGAASNATAFWNGTKPSTTVVSLSANNSVMNAGKDYIMYCFHSVDGFSKVGSYIGNGNADGSFVYTGFRPKWILSKESSASGGNWAILDAERNTYNVLDNELYPNSSVAEATSSTTSGLFCDFTSNGFKLRTSSGAQNQSGQTMIYLAFAEQPFKYSNAR